MQNRGQSRLCLFLLGVCLSFARGHIASASHSAHTHTHTHFRLPASHEKSCKMWNSVSFKKALWGIVKQNSFHMYLFLDVGFQEMSNPYKLKVELLQHLGGCAILFYRVSVRTINQKYSSHFITVKSQFLQKIKIDNLRNSSALFNQGQVTEPDSPPEFS